MAEGDVELGPVDTDDPVQLTVQLLLKCDEEAQLLLKHDEEVLNRSNQYLASIFMVPRVYRDLSPYSYTPRVVSIGPLHHQDKHLIGFEAHKTIYMHNLLHNILSDLDSTPEEIFKECVWKVSDSIDQIKACYIGMPAYSDSELVKMMVTDACFILAYLYKPKIRYSSLRAIVLLRTEILLDMVLVENQIPFFVLQDIFECTFSKVLPTQSLADFLSDLQHWCNIFKGDLVMDNSCFLSTHDHILGFIHKSYQNPDRDYSSILLENPKSHSAVELYRSGVKFSNKLGAKWPMAMKLELSGFQGFPLLWSKPTLKMRTLRLNDSKESIIRNLIIYEQSSQVQACVTSYMLALDYLIDTPEDVAKLVKSQVIVNGLGSDEKAANLINNMLEKVIIKDFFYQDEWKQMDEYYNAYYNAYWPKLIAEFRRKYFSNPWSLIALIAGIVLFVLTVVQTIYGVKDSKAA